MKKITRCLAALGLTVALAGCGAALAAEAPAIHVQLNGRDLTFTDAVPQVKEQRTFLPFRAVFEAMGAEVSNEGSVITATRDGKTLTMTLDSTEAVLTEGGKTTPITMDVAPYVDPATWRTYVPVRFAAQAMGCAVGWDQANSTAVIVDVDKVMDAALEGKKFTYLEELMAFSEKYNKGAWDMEAAFDAEIAVMSFPMTMSGSVTGTMQDNEKMSMDMNMKLDMTQFIKMVSLLSLEQEGLTEEEQAMLKALKEKGIDLSMRGDLAQGTLYMNMAGELLAASGMSPENWYKMDMNDLMAQSGMNMDWTELLSASKDLDYAALCRQTLSSLELNDVTAYGQVRAMAKEIAAALSDEGFVRQGNVYTTTIRLGEGTAESAVTIALVMAGEKAVGYRMGLSLAMTRDDTVISMEMNTEMDDKDQMKADMTMEAGEVLTMSLKMTGKYAPSQTAPAVEPPAGASVVDYIDLISA